ncbi:hypothetical protein P8452_18545 [Trifolium repens]|nr:hypothetical protein P8452_18545 [Trifolium repens]
MEIINNSPETSDYEEEDNVSQARDREVPLQNAELSEEVASKAKKKTKRKAKEANQDEKPQSAFSIGARVLTKYRSSMKVESVQALLCARSWLYGFQELDDVDNIDKDDETHGSVQESNSVEYVNID